LIALGPTLNPTVGAAGSELTVRVVDCDAVPPKPTHSSEKLDVLDSLLVIIEPLNGCRPDQAPCAKHFCALAEDHVSVAAFPFAVVLGNAPILTVGTAGGTDMTTDCVVLPLDPRQVMVYVELALIGPVDCEPRAALEPDHAPDATHVSASFALQVSIVD
jgi:hypothetical protein